jgi:hypothetical protein
MTDLAERIAGMVRHAEQHHTPLCAIRTADLARLLDDLARSRALLDAILAADERGQGLPFAEAMQAAHRYLLGE